MYPVSESYKQAVVAPDRFWDLKVNLQTAFESFDLTAADITENSLQIKETVMTGQVFGLGGVAAADLSLTLANTDGRFDTVQLNGAIIKPQVGLMVAPDTFEWIPMGVYVVDTVESLIKNPDRPFRSIRLLAGDNMLLLDKPFSKVNIPFPCTAKQLLQAVCFYCGLPLATTSFLHDDYMISARPEGDMTCRDIVSCIAELAGCWARCDRNGYLVLKWFKNPGAVQECNIDGNVDDADGGDFAWWNNLMYDGGTFTDDEPDAVLDVNNRFDLSFDDDPIVITGITLETDEGYYTVGSERYAIAITDNPLIQHSQEDVLRRIYEKLADFTFLPFTASRRDDPAMQAGDMVELVGADGSVYRTVITHYDYVFRGKSKVQAVGASEVAKGYKPTLQKKVSQLRRKIAEKQEQLDAMEIAVRNATSIISGMWGGYKIDGDTLDNPAYKGNTFIADHPNVELAQKIWRINLGGIGFSTNGVNGPYSSAWTNDGTFLTNLIVANMIKTGLLQSSNGKSWINLDDGTFSFGNGALKWNGTTFEAVSAEKLTNAESDGTHGVIGQGPEGLDSYGLFLVSPIYGEIFQVYPRYHSGELYSYIRFKGDTIYFFKNDNTFDHDFVFLKSDLLGTEIAWKAPSGSAEASMRLSTGGISFTVDGQAHGITATLPKGAMPIVKNGLIVGYTT